MGTHSLSAPFWKLTKWLKRPFEDVSSTRMLRSIRSSKCEINGFTHPMLQVGVFPAPDGARPSINRFPFSRKESNSLTVVLPINALVHGNLPAKGSSVEVPWLFEYKFSHLCMWVGAISSHGMWISASFLSRSLSEFTSRSPPTAAIVSAEMKWIALREKLQTKYTWEYHLLIGSWNVFVTFKVNNTQYLSGCPSKEKNCTRVV